MDLLSIITKKKLGQTLTREEIEFFAEAAAQGSAPDYQLAALLMAIRLNGMDARETADLTMAMARSGDLLEPDVGGVPVDKHSTGGVGDTTTLVLAPLVAAAGGKVLKMSGRGLGHTGGTVDKMESIPGMRVSLPEEEFVAIVRRIGCAVVGQSAELAPADKRLYALRDVTSTVDSIPLIASSILSKKFASGARAIVLDVKFGSGAIMDSLAKSVELAQAMVDIGTHAGRQVIAVLSSMAEPLGTHVGNALEVKEAIDILAGRAGGDLKEVSLFLGAQMLRASGVSTSFEAAKASLEKVLQNGAGLQKLREMIAAQGGDPRVCDDPGLLPQAPLVRDVAFESAGYVAEMDTAALGLAAQGMGAGRKTKEDVIDPAVGFVMRARLGGRVRPGDPIATLHARDEASLAAAAEAIRKAVVLSDAPVQKPALIHAVITQDGMETLSSDL
ncbi:MAG: thymidine phosphorylase [Clostridia bacterium]|nr:thymidine phosphorylase [Clostridia bacterium]